MKHRLSRIVAITALYILIILGIFIIQFTIGKTFSYNIGAMTVSGRHDTDMAGNTAPLLPLHIISNGLDFYITEKNPVIALKADGSEIPLKVLEYKSGENSFTIDCSDKVSVNFTSYDLNAEINSIRISVLLPQEITAVYFPWKLSGSARLERQNNQIFLRHGKKRYVFKGGYGFENSSEDINSEFPHLILTAEKPAAQYETYIESKSLAFENIPNNPLASDTVYEETRKNFKNQAEVSLKNSLQSKNYNEAVLTAYIAQAAYNGGYRKALLEAPASLLPKEKRTYLSCTFYNNLLQNSKLLAARNIEKIREITADITRRNAAVFNIKSLLPYLMYHSRANLIVQLERIAASLPENDLKADIAAGILEASMDFDLYFPERQNTFRDMEEKCETALKAALFSTDEGLYISSDSQTVDTEKTLRIASVLIRYGKEDAQKRIWKAAGQMLYSSIFLLSGNSSALPASFDIQGDKSVKIGLKADDSVILRAERLYPMAVTDNAFYPHEENLANHGGHGFWAWTSAKRITVVQNTAKNFNFKVEFKEGETHHLILHGVRPFIRIQIHGIDFRSDHRFELYNSSGYVYDAASRTLLLKLKHRKDEEEIMLFFGEPPQPVPAPPSSAVQENTEESAPLPNTEPPKAPSAAPDQKSEEQALIKEDSFNKTSYEKRRKLKSRKSLEKTVLQVRKAGKLMNFLTE